MCYAKGLLRLLPTHKKTPEIQAAMAAHYSAPKGFVGRSICYEVRWNETLYGFTVGGSTPRYLAGRNKTLKNIPLNNIVNNIFFHITTHEGKYPTRNFTSKVVKAWREQVTKDWFVKYGDIVLGFETLVELPRTGELYRRDGWTEVGLTKGFTCKRIAGKGTDSYSGKRVWDTKNLRPKRVFTRRVMEIQELKLTCVKAWPDNKPKGQCAVTALIVQDLFGGKLKRALVGGVSHYWNELPNGEEVDLTREQFDTFEPEQIIERTREYVLSFPDTVKRYEALKEKLSFGR